MENFEHSTEMETGKNSFNEAKPYVPQQVSFDENYGNPDDILSQLDNISSSPEKGKDIYEICNENLKHVTDCLDILSSKALSTFKMDAFDNMKKCFNPDGTITIVERSGKGFSEKKLTLNMFFDRALKNFQSGIFNYGYMKVDFYKGKISEMFIAPKEECNNSISTYTDKDFESFSCLIK